jgi:hypothetical protein
MNDRNEPDEYRTIFDAARLNASIRIQELDDAAEISALATMVQILRPSAIVIIGEPRQGKSTNKPMNPSGGSGGS